DTAKAVTTQQDKEEEKREAKQFLKSSLLAWMTKDKAVQRVKSKVKQPGRDTCRLTSQLLSYTEQAFKTELMAGFSEITDRFPALVRELIEAQKKRGAKGNKKRRGRAQ